MSDDKHSCHDPLAGTIRIVPTGQAYTGEYEPPGDRCITHRALILGALALGPTYLLNALESAETVATRRVLAQLGVVFSTDDDGWLVISRRERQYNSPKADLDCNHSITTLFLVAGMLAGQGISATLTGYEDLLNCDCQALSQNLTALGVSLECLGQSNHPPLRLDGKIASPLNCQLEDCSSLLKDALLLAGLAAPGTNRISGAAIGPDHLERLLKQMGVNLHRSGDAILMKGRQNIHPRRIKIPGDLSMAVPLLVLATLIPGSDLLVHLVGANPNRIGLVKVLQRAGAQLSRVRDWQYSNEPVCDLHVQHTPQLDAFNLAPNMIPHMTAEFPLAAVLATQASGSSHLKDGGALRHEAPNILQLTAHVLRQFGADIEEEDDGLAIHGSTQLYGTEVQCAGNRQIALAAMTAALIAEGESTLHGALVLEESYPGLIASLIDST